MQIPSLNSSMLVNNGLTVKALSLLEINLLAVHAGLLLQLKLSLIEFVLQVIKLYKLQFPLKIYWNAVLIIVVWVVKVVILALLGAI